MPERYWKMSGRCMEVEGVWKMYARCMESIWKVSGRYPDEFLEVYMYTSVQV